MPTQRTYTFRIEGMHCASCGVLIDDELDDLDGVISTRTSLRSGRSTVVVDPDRCGPEQILTTIAAAGYHARQESP